MNKKCLGVLLAAVLALTSLTACGGKAPEETTAPAAETTAPAAETTAPAEETTAPAEETTAPAAAGIAYADIKIGEIESYIIDDGGWCQATHEGIVAAMKTLGIPEENLIVLESIDDTDQATVQAAAEQLADEGCNLIIGASTGYAAYLPEVAANYPDVVFAQWGNKTPGLTGYEIRSYEGMFIAGYVSELLSQDTNTQLGFSASFDEFSVRTAINAYALGAKYANEAATVKVACANTWYDIDVETQCAQSLIDAGIKYMGMEASSPAIPETCAKNGAFVVGYHNDMSYLAPEAVLVSFTWNFAPIFEQILTGINAGEDQSDAFYYLGGECSKLTAFADFVPAEVVDQANDLAGKLASGEVQVYGGELKDRDGNVLVADGQVMPDEQIILQEFFVENVECGW